MRPRASRRAKRGRPWIDFDEFWERGYFEMPASPKPIVLFEKFRANPNRHKLATPSGRIEIFSEKIAGFGYDDCLGHPAWLEPAEWLGSPIAKEFPLHLITTQPSTRLHGQMDMGRVSQQSKVAGREPIRINRDDAASARNSERRHRARVQPSRRDSRRRRGQRRDSARRRADVDRRVVRPRASRTSSAASTSMAIRMC